MSYSCAVLLGLTWAGRCYCMMAVTRGYRLFWYRLRKTDIVISYNTSLLFGLWSRLTITWHGGEPPDHHMAWWGAA